VILAIVVLVDMKKLANVTQSNAHAV